MKNDAIQFDDLAYDNTVYSDEPVHGNRGTRPGDRPIRSEFELQELGEQLVEAKEAKREVILRIWKRREPVHGRIAKLDGMTQMVHVQRHGETVKVPFADILSVADFD